jgi:hypothetical protein
LLHLAEYISVFILLFLGVGISIGLSRGLVSSLHLVNLVSNLNLVLLLQVSENVHSFLNFTRVAVVGGLLNLLVHLRSVLMDENHNYSLSRDGVTIRALGDGVNNNSLGWDLLLINNCVIREVAHHIIGLLLSGVSGVKSHGSVSIVEASRSELGGRVYSKLSSLVRIHSVHRLHHHLHVLLLLELVVIAVLVTAVLVSRGTELVVVHKHLVHIVLEHHLLLVMLLEEGIGRLREVGTIASGHHMASTSTILVASSTAITATTATSLMALIARHGT